MKTQDLEYNMLVTWQASNIIFVDQPTGTGFSYNTDVRDLRYDEKGVSNDMYDFLQVCFISSTNDVFDKYLV